MKIAGKRIMAVFIAAVMMLVMVPLLGTQKAYAEELIDFGNSYNCDWRYFKNASGKYVLHIGNMVGCDGDMGNYKLNSDFESTAAWAQYRNQVDELEFDGVTNIGDYAFYQFTKLSKVDLRDVKRIGDHAFYACTGLTSIHIDGDECVIENQAFDECWRNGIVMDEVTLEGVKTLGDHAFGEVDCWDLYLGEGLESIGPSCFYCNERLLYVTIPQSCKSIDKNAFVGCTHLSTVYIKNQACTIGEYALDKDYLNAIFGSAGSTAEAYARDNNVPFAVAGNRGTGMIDLSSGYGSMQSGDPTSPDYPALASFEAIWADNMISQESEGSNFYFDLDNDGTRDLRYETDDKNVVMFSVLPERSIGGKIKFTLSDNIRTKLEYRGFPHYGILVFDLEKFANPMTVSAKAAAVKYSKLKKKNQTLLASKVLTIKNAKGSKIFRKLKGNSKITINRTTGKVTVKKGLKKGTYKIKVKVTADGNDSYEACSKTVTFTIKVK